MEFTPQQHTKRKKYLRALIYGPSKSGKTVFAGSFPDPFFIEFDVHGSQVISKNTHNWLPDDFGFIRMQDPYDGREYAKYLKKTGCIVDPSKMGAGLPVETIISDAVSKLWVACQNRYKKGKGKQTEEGVNKKPLSPLEWVEVKNQFREYVMTIASANAHTVFTTQISHDNSGMTKAQVSAEIEYEVDLTLEMLAKDDKRNKKKAFPCALVINDRTGSPYKPGDLIPDPRFSMWEPHLNNISNKAHNTTPVDPGGPTLGDNIESCMNDVQVIMYAKQLGMKDKDLRASISTYHGDIEVVLDRLRIAAIAQCCKDEEIIDLAKKLGVEGDGLKKSVTKHNGIRAAIVKILKDSAP